MEKKFQKFVNQITEKFCGYPCVLLSQSLYDKGLIIDTGCIVSSVILNVVSLLAVKLGVRYYVTTNDDYDGVVVKCYVG